MIKKGTYIFFAAMILFLNSATGASAIVYRGGSSGPGPWARYLSGESRTFKDIVGVFVSLLDQAIPIFFALALLIFFWGVARFILNAGNEAARTAGRKFMLYGIITLFVIFAIWGIVKALDCTFLSQCGSSDTSEDCIWVYLEDLGDWQCI